MGGQWGRVQVLDAGGATFAHQVLWLAGFRGSGATAGFHHGARTEAGCRMKHPRSVREGRRSFSKLRFKWCVRAVCCAAHLRLQDGDAYRRRPWLRLPRSSKVDTSPTAIITEPDVQDLMAPSSML